MNYIQQPLITVVTITYNLIDEGREKYFRQCLESVHNQTYENIEHIIIDGASNDGTINLIEEYKKKGWITYISEKDDGIYDAMNKGIKKSNGKYIAFLNSDDFYHNKIAIELSVESLERENADYSFADVISIDCSNEKQIGHWRGDINLLPFGVHYCHQTMFVRLDVLQELGGFNTLFKVSADSDLMIRLFSLSKKHIYVDDKIASYRSGGLSSQYSNQCRMDHSLSFYKHIGKNENLTLNDCYNIWNFSLLNERSPEYCLKIASIFRRKEWSKELICKMYKYYSKNSFCNYEIKKIKISKSFRLGNLFFRSIKKPYKLITYPYNFIKILLEK